jgi:hypothetical protein
MTETDDDFLDEDTPLIAEYCRRLDDAKKRIARAIGSPPARLFHYTTPKGLLGIVGEARFRATDVFHLNDRAELVLGRDRMDDIAAELGLAEGDWKPSLRPCSMFAVSFSEEPDSLPQWRSYAGDGLGYALGIDTRQEPAMVGAAPAPVLALFPEFITPYLRRMIYLKEEQDALARDVVAALRSARDWFDKEPKSDQQASTGVMLYSRALGDARLDISAMLKNESFETEREWRYVVRSARPWPKAKFRESAFGLTPFAEIEFGEKLPLREIVMGPKIDPSVGTATLSCLLAERGYLHGFTERPMPGVDEIVIRSSAATYR